MSIRIPVIASLTGYGKACITIVRGSRRVLLQRIGGMARRWKPKAAKGALILAGAWIVTGCMTTQQMAPPVSDVMSGIGLAPGITGQSLEQGRQIYLSQCGKCHSIEPVNRYSDRRWKEIMEEMAAESRLGDHQKTDVLAYILTARRFMEMTEDRESKPAIVEE